MKHTSGPWEAKPAPHGPIDILDSQGRDVVTVYGGGVGTESKLANARLIAAAPDLLACVVMALESSGYEHERKIFHAAISKATGGA